MMTKICEFIQHLTSLDNTSRHLIVLGSMHMLPYIYHSIDKKYHFQNLISIRLKKVKKIDNFLPNEHVGLIIFSTTKQSLNHVRKPYQFCKCCKNTVKDYGGKKHLLNKEGTRISDVWTDIQINLKQKIPLSILQRVLDLTKKDKNENIHFFSLDKKMLNKWKLSNLSPEKFEKINPALFEIKSKKLKLKTNIIFNSDVLTGFKKIPDNSVNLALVDPPYNISIKYGDFSDNLDDYEYLQWCKKWIDEISRTLKRGGLLTLVNIPLWSIELFPYLQKRLTFQGWISWDAFSYPHTPVIPAHYPILCFSKGPTIRHVDNSNLKNSDEEILNPLNFGYCIRSICLKKRTNKMKHDRKPISDLWTDIHRIRHNSFRYNHPTLMPQKLAKRIISIFSNPNDVILDCFNGVGTTSLVADSLARKYIGIEKNKSYYKTSLGRHSLLQNGLNPFDKTQSKSTSKNKGYPEVKHQSKIQKMQLQIEVKNVARKLGHCPSPSELEQYGKYPLRYYYNNFLDWAQITVATRRTGI
ncbi:MAG: DNA-methyltransferase [Candidatus Nitrosopumilus sp. bin_68KS]